MTECTDFTGKKYRPVTLPGDMEHYFVGVYEQEKFVMLHSIHSAPLDAIDEADRLNKEQGC
jgi:hypothetical protein